MNKYIAVAAVVGIASTQNVFSPKGQDHSISNVGFSDIPSSGARHLKSRKEAKMEESKTGSKKRSDSKKEGSKKGSKTGSKKGSKKGSGKSTTKKGDGKKEEGFDLWQFLFGKPHRTLQWSDILRLKRERAQKGKRAGRHLQANKPFKTIMDRAKAKKEQALGKPVDSMIQGGDVPNLTLNEDNLKKLKALKKQGQHKADAKKALLGRKYELDTDGKVKKDEQGRPVLKAKVEAKP